MKNRLNLQIEYNEKNDLLDLFYELMVKIVKDQEKFGNDRRINYNYEYRIKDINRNYREEMINGKWCQVYESKMNKDEHI